MSAPTIAIVGASADRSKYGNLAVRAYAAKGYRVFPVHPSASAIEGHKAFRAVGELPVERLDRISVYLPPAISLGILDDLASKPAGQVWFNPGADAPEVLERAHALGLNVVAGCSIMAVGVRPELSF